MKYMNKKIYRIFAACMMGCGMSAALTSCTGDLDQVPQTEATSETVYTSLEGFEAVMGKIYTSMVTTGQGKGGANADLSSISGHDYMRCYFNMQECGTDEVASTWLQGDKTADLTYLSWDSNDPWVSDMYYRIYYNITLCNEFLRNCTDEKIAQFGNELRHYRAEARTMRAMFYLHALDLYRNIPFVDENSGVGGYIPPRYEPAQTFAFIEKELTEATPDLYGKAECPYGRMSKGGAQTLLARLYLNSETWTGTAKYNECINACKQVFAEGYSLEKKSGTPAVDAGRAAYQSLFNADNHLRTNEIIFALPVDSDHIVSWGASTYIVCGEVASTGTSQKAEDYGVTSGWGMFRARGQLPQMWLKSSLTPENEDGRFMFHMAGQTQYIDNIAGQDQSQGYCVNKWTNLNDNKQQACNTANKGVATDYPLMRLADVYLMYAEAVVRGAANGTRAEALDYINQLRQRAYGSNNGDITDAEMTLDFILDERARELYWEGYRRSDLVRFGKFTTADYLWEWKGGSKNGVAVDKRYNYYPIPSTELTANPNLSNPEY